MHTPEDRFRFNPPASPMKILGTSPPRFSDFNMLEVNSYPIDQKFQFVHYMPNNTKMMMFHFIDTLPRHTGEALEVTTPLPPSPAALSTALERGTLVS